MPPAARLRRIVTGKGGAKEKVVENDRGRKRDGEKGTGGKGGRATEAGMKRARKRVKGKKGEKRTSSSWDEDSWRIERREDRRTSDRVLEDPSRDLNRIESDRFRKRGAARAR